MQCRKLFESFDNCCFAKGKTDLFSWVGDDRFFFLCKQFLAIDWKIAQYTEFFRKHETYKNYDPNSFIKDLANVPFHIVNLFDEPDDQVHAFNCLFLPILIWMITLPSNELRSIQGLIHSSHLRLKSL